MEAAISCSGLTKDYGGGRGILDLDLEVAPGEVFGFIGPNGAGKTTTIRLLMDLVRADRGRATVFGLDSHRDAVAIKRLVGYQPGELPLYPRARVSQILGLLASLRGGVDDADVMRLADRFSVDLGRSYSDLSHGNKQKVWLVQAFMHRPRLVILDEPTLGLDPLMQSEFRALVAETVAAGATVFLSSHDLGEVQTLCTRIALVSEGRLLRAGTLEELRELRVHRVDASFEGELDPAAVARIPGVADVAVSDHHLHCTVRGPVAPLLATLVSARAVEVDSEELSLEEVFLAAFGKRSA